MKDGKIDNLSDMDEDEFRRAAHRVADVAADYLSRIEEHRVLPDIEPGEVRRQLPAAPPVQPEALETILEDYRRLIEPNVTQWQHPGFMAYFPCTASGPGILGEWLASALNSNVMFWKNAPASTELEQLVVDWLRQMLGLPAGFDGMFTDTASVSSLLSLVAARHAIEGLDAREQGLAGRPEVGRLRMYASEQAHSSIDRAAIVTGIGRAGLRHIPVDSAYRMRIDALERAIAEDRAHGWTPFMVVGTLGTTSTTSVDPAREIARVCERERMWFHVDAAYGGTAAILPEKRELLEGWELADSIVVNPHKWMFTPFDASLLLFRRPAVFRDAFSLVPDYLRDSQVEHARNYSEYGVQLGRRFRALKLWIMIRYFGTEGFASRMREHCRLAGLLTSWIDAAADWERLAPVPFSTVCFRYRPPDVDPGDARLDAWNEAILDRVNRTGEIYLSPTRLAGRYTLRVALGNLRQTEQHVERCWSLLRAAARDGVPR